MPDDSVLRFQYTINNSKAPMLPVPYNIIFVRKYNILLLRAKRSGGAAGASAERSKLFPMLWGLKIAR